MEHYIKKEVFAQTSFKDTISSKLTSSDVPSTKFFVQTREHDK